MIQKILKNAQNRNGFTLLEIIVSLIVAAIMGSMLVTVTGSALRRSAQPIQAVQSVYSLEYIMETVNMYYLGRIYDSTETDVLGKVSTFINGNYSSYVDAIDRYPSFSGGVLASTDPNGPIMKVTFKDPSTGASLTSLFYDKPS